uniref:Uncharacterized protein n=1 Tax=Anguilla anguilla TaxID=7936 RepID=A0A0E9S785_ANGAN
MPILKYTSIHYLYPLILGRDAGVLEPIPACFGREAGIDPGRAANPSQDTHTTHSHTHTYGQFRVYN